MNIDEVRRLNLLEYIKQACKGNKAEFARKLEMSASYLSRLTREPTEQDLANPRATSKRKLSPPKAREIEKKLKLENGYFDTPDAYQRFIKYPAPSIPTHKNTGISEMKTEYDELQTRSIPLLSWVLACNWAKAYIRPLATREPKLELTNEYTICGVAT